MRNKYFFKLFLFLFIPYLDSLAYSNYHAQLIDLEEPQVSQGDGLFEIKTKDALLSYEIVEKKADYFAFKLKNLTFGDYSEQVLYAAPLFTGKLEFSIHRIQFSFDIAQNKSSLKYKIYF